MIRLLIGGTSAHLRYLRGPLEQHRGKVPIGQIIDFFGPKIGASRPIEEMTPKPRSGTQALGKKATGRDGQRDIDAQMYL